MTPEREIELKDYFASRFEAAHKAATDAARAAVHEALVVGSEDLGKLRQEYQRVSGLHFKKTDSLAAMVRAWPKEFPALPEWISDPDEAERKDPLGKPHVIAIGQLPEPVELTDDQKKIVEAVDIDAILKKRADRAKEEALRPPPAPPQNPRGRRRRQAED